MSSPLLFPAESLRHTHTETHKNLSGSPEQVRWDLWWSHLPVMSTFRASACLLRKKKEDELRHRRSHSQKDLTFPHEQTNLILSQTS